VTALLFGVMLATVVVHEAGHAAAAALLRLPWRPVITWIGPGVAIGRDGLDLTRRQVVITAAAGPLANLALAAVAYGFGQPIVVMMGVLFAVTNLAPFPYSDGARMLRPGHAIARAKAAALVAQESR
jgi:stage IV sporulation protein FB